MIINNVCFNLLVFPFSPLYFILVELDSYTCSAFIIHPSPEEPLAAEGLLILERIKMKSRKLFQQSYGHRDGKLAMRICICHFTGKVSL